MEPDIHEAETEENVKKEGSSTVGEICDAIVIMTLIICITYACTHIPHR